MSGQWLLDGALADPWGTLDVLLDGPLHPGGAEATAALLDRAGVGDDTRLLDVGCGAGGALELARDRGATAVGLDRAPGGGGGPGGPDSRDRFRIVRGDMGAVPVRTGAVDVVLAECVLCLSDDLDRALAETRRVLAPGGRLALSDVVVDGDLPDVPADVAGALCLTGTRDREHLLAAVERAGYTVAETRDHRDDLLAMRDELAGRVDYEGLLGAMGEEGQRLLSAVEDLEAAVEGGRVGYVSLVARADGR